MNPTLEIIEQFAPPALCLLAIIPVLFLFAVNKNKEKPILVNHNLLLAYLICLGIMAFVFLVLKAIELMPQDSGARALFICSMLIVACIDQALILLPVTKRPKFDLAGLLFYSVVLLCFIPLLWQISMHVIPDTISNQASIMGVVQITLMLTMVILCFANGIVKKRKN